MSLLRALHSLPAILAAAAHAGELTISPAEFFVSSRFEAVVVPSEYRSISRTPGVPAGTLAPHGILAEAGQSLLRLDTKALEREVAKARLDRQEHQLSSDRAALTLKQLQESAPLKIRVLKHAAAAAGEDLRNFTTSGRKASEERSRLGVLAARRTVEKEKAELSRLEKLHEGEKKDAAPEPPPVTRQKEAAAAAELSLRLATQDHERTLQVRIPREAGTLELREAEATLALRHAEEALVREQEFLKAELDLSRAALESTAAPLAALEARLKEPDFHAPSAGWWLHGNPTGLSGNGAEIIATFVPVQSPMTLTARVTGEVAGLLGSGQEGHGDPVSGTGPPVILKVSTISETPDESGLHPVTLIPAWPEGARPAPGTAFQVRFISHHKNEAIAIPSRALASGPGGWTVEVKLADGKTEPRPVKPGISADGRTEILEGLERGQVIIVPDGPE